jgi:Dolichyl-phosphate-mannose-protein mannosyltransferase
LPVQIQPATTAAINPEKTTGEFFFSSRKHVISVSLILLMIVGFALRVGNLGAESLSEDELNKLQTVADYRANGLSGRNGEHPFLMKGMQTISIAIAEKINTLSDNKISEGAALRFPTVLIGTLTILVLFLLISELFGSSIGLIAAALWACEPSAIGFDRIAKEDSFLLCFFLLGCFFWIRGQTVAERGGENWLKYMWLAAAAFGAMIASKYLPHLLAISAAYYQIFQAIPATKWRLGKMRWLRFFVILGVCFLIFNPTILLPETWREMLTFSGEKRIGHDSYEYFGTLYKNQATAWLAGVPWTFYYVFILFKTSILTLLFFVIGLPAIFQRKFGDGRYFVFFWALFWFMPFTVLGGKFTRYFAVGEPLILIIAAVGFYSFVKWIAPKISNKQNFAPMFSVVCFVVIIGFSLYNSLSFTPHFRLYTNALGGGKKSAGSYFPHDEFYDTSTREIIAEINKTAQNGATIANETPGLFEHYAKQIGREDLVFVSLSDKSRVAALKSGDFIAAARGRRYFSNDELLKFLETISPVAEIKIDGISSAKIYQLNDENAAQINQFGKD